MRNQSKFLQTSEMLVPIAFGIAYFLADFRIATIVLIAAMTVFVGLVKIVGEKLTKIQLASWLAIVILGGASVLLKDDSILKWKPTVINAAIGLTFLLTHIFGDKTLLERLIDKQVPAPARMLRRVNFAASLFFLFTATLNIVIAYTFSTTAWVNFKLFGNFALNICFLSGCLYYLRAYLAHILPPEQNGKK